MYVRQSRRQFSSAGALCCAQSKFHSHLTRCGRVVLAVRRLRWLPNPTSFSYPETSFAPSLQGNTSLIVPPEPDALDMLSPPLETRAPADSAAPQSIPATPLMAPRDPVNTAPPLMTPRDLVSTAKMPHGPFP